MSGQNHNGGEFLNTIHTQQSQVKSSTMNTLSSLSMLKVSINEGKDYLSYLHPYIVHILHLLLKEDMNVIVTDESVSKKLRNVFGFEIPLRTVQVLLKRLAKQKLLKRINHTYMINKLPDDTIPRNKADVDRHISHVVREVMEFSKKYSRRNITEEEAHASIIAFLEQFSIPFLRSFQRGTALPTLSKKSSWEITLVANFIQKIKINPELFASFEKIVEGHMLANALLCPDLEEISDTYGKVIFYFDTPLLIELLGLEGSEKEDAAKELISLIHNLKGKVSYFSHTREEVISVVDYAIKHIDDDSCTMPVVLSSRINSLSKADLIVKRENMEEYLSLLAIHQTNTPSYDLKRIPLNFDEKEFENILLSKVNYRREKAASYDVKSVRSIYLLRNRHSASVVEKSKAILVSSNTEFARASAEYKENIEGNYAVPSVITDFSLANMAWLKAPQGAPSLPRKEILAFAYAALMPTQSFWGKVLDEADKLEKAGIISSRDHQLLRSSPNVIAELMGLTLGDDNALTAESILETVTRVSAEIRKEETERLSQEQQEHQKTQSKLAQKMNQLDEIKEKLYWECKKKAKRRGKIMFYSIWALLLFIAGASLAALLNYQNILVIPLLLVGIMIKLIGHHFDFKPKLLSKRFEEYQLKTLIMRKHKEFNISNPAKTEITQTSAEK